MIQSSLALEIIHLLQSRGRQAFLVGGCVRDRLLGTIPKDYDVATDAPPDELIRLFPRSDKVGAHFGVVLVYNEAGEQVEVATFRSEGTYSDGRRPDQVHFETSPRQDALRRDFTINALFENPTTGEVIDYVGGREDLAQRRIRAIGDPERRFREDHLRMLRAVRFAARLQFSIEPFTLRAIQNLAQEVRNVSAERIRGELTRILTEAHPRRGLELLDQTKLLSVVLPEVKALQGVEQPPQFHPEGDVWTHTLLMFDLLRKPASTTLALGVLLHDIGKPPTFRIAERIRFDGHVEAGVEIARSILDRLRYSTNECEQVMRLVANHMRFKDIKQMKPSTLKRFFRLPCFDEHLELHRVDCLASHKDLTSYDYAIEQRAALPETEIQPPRLLTGRDLIAAGFVPGPAFGAALHEVETAQLDGQIQTKEEALEIAVRVLQNSQHAAGGDQAGAVAPDQTSSTSAEAST